MSETRKARKLLLPGLHFSRLCLARQQPVTPGFPRKLEMPPVRRPLRKMISSIFRHFLISIHLIHSPFSPRGVLVRCNQANDQQEEEELLTNFTLSYTPFPRATVLDFLRHGRKSSLHVSGQRNRADVQQHRRRGSLPGRGAVPEAVAVALRRLYFLRPMLTKFPAHEKKNFIPMIFHNISRNSLT